MLLFGKSAVPLKLLNRHPLTLKSIIVIYYIFNVDKYIYLFNWFIESQPNEALPTNVKAERLEQEGFENQVSNDGIVDTYNQNKNTEQSNSGDIKTANPCEKVEGMYR